MQGKISDNFLLTFLFKPYHNMKVIYIDLILYIMLRSLLKAVKLLTEKLIYVGITASNQHACYNYRGMHDGGTCVLPMLFNLLTFITQGSQRLNAERSILSFMN